MSLVGFRNLTKKIVCVGRNYKDHALELGNPIPKKPMLFVKTTNSLIEEGEKIRIPPGCENLHQEVELAIVISQKAQNVKKTEAFDYVGGYAIALDMTARDFQVSEQPLIQNLFEDEAKKSGAPWFLAKSFDTSCPVSKFIEKSAISDPHNEELYCKINGVDKQRCRTDVMIFDIPTLIEYVTQFVTLEEGDILLTGTPAGVCRVVSGDVLEFGLTGGQSAKFFVE